MMIDAAWYIVQQSACSLWLLL